MADEIEQLRAASLRDPSLLVRLADTLVAAGRGQEAVSTCRAALARRPDDVPLRLALGRALSAIGNLEEAQAAMLDAVARQKRQAEELAKPKTTVPPASKPPVAAPAPAPAPAPSSKATGFDATNVKTTVGSKTTPPGSNNTPTDQEVVLPTARGSSRDALAALRAGAPSPVVPPTASAPPPPIGEFDEELTRKATRRPFASPGPTPTGEVSEADIADSFPIDTPAPVPAAAPPNGEAHDYAEAAPDADPGPGPGPNEAWDLDAVARTLLASPQRALKTGEIPQSAEQVLIERGFDQRRRTAYRWLWGAIIFTAVGGAGAYIYRAQEKLRLLQLTIERAAERSRDATYDGDRAARDAYVSILRSGQKSMLYYALAAKAESRLAADHGEDSDSAAWSYLRRAEKRQGTQAPDASTTEALRQARALLALSRGESCTQVLDTDGDLAARCAVQRGEVGAARKLLAGMATGPDAPRALIALSSLELGAGDTDGANSAVGKILAKTPNHITALLLRALIALERGEKPVLPDSIVALIEPKQPLPPDAPQVGPLGTSYYYLLRAQQLLADKNATDADINAALDKAQPGLRSEPRGMLIYARARLRQGKLVEAERAMRGAERLSPNDPEVAVLDAEVALAKGFEDKVATALSAATELNPRAQSVLGRAYVLLGRNKDAVAALDGALGKRPGDPTTIAYRAIARSRLGDANGAEKELGKYGELGGSVTFAHGVIALERKDTKKAEGFLLKAAERSVESLRARALLGKMYREQGKFTEAIAQLEKAVDFAPSLGVAVTELGRAYVELGRFRDARRVLRPVIEGGKASSDDALNFAEASIQLGFLAEGEAQLAAAKATGPRAERLAALVQSWKGAKEATAAEKTIEKLRKGPGAADAKLGLAAGDIYRRAGNLKAATAAYEASALGEPMRARLGIGKVALMQNDLGTAEAAFKAAIEAWDKRPYSIDDRSEARIGLARGLIGRKSLADAGELLEKAIADDPESAEAYYYLAKVLSEQGDPKAALAKAERASQLDEQYAEAFLLVGELAAKTDKIKAKQAYEKFLQLQPNAPQAKAVKKVLAGLK